jgi:LuxR family maltose regulon positive regulatory protein
MRIDKLAPTVNTTKLAPPGKHSGLLVDRAELCARIARRATRRLTTIVAPAGYGKTSLLTQVRHEIDSTTAATGWLSVDEEDNDLGRFLLHLVEALRSNASHTGQATLALLRSGVSLPATVLKTTLLNELLGIDKDTFLFIDDFHLITDRSVIAITQAILLAPIEHLHLLVATRDARTLPLSQLRVRGDLLEIGVQDLKFSVAEVGDFFARQNGAPISPDLVGLLHDRTEGWVAGLQFAAIALRDNDDPCLFLARFSGQHRNVGDFLAEEVFERQSEPIQGFLLATCILKRFDTGLCNAVTERSDAREYLDQLERANLFVFSLDTEKQWYRYHHLFSEFLQRRLHERQPDLYVELHRRACNWLAAHGHIVDAIEHAFAAQDESLAAKLLDAASAHLFAAGQIASIRTYAARLPEHLAARCPQLQLDLAWDCELHWQFLEARQALENARAALESRRTDQDASGRAQHKLLMSKLAHREMMLSMLSDDIPATLALCHQWLAAATVADTFMRASTETALMLCRRETYCVDGVAAATETTHEMFVKGGAVYGTAFHNSIAGTTLFAAGQLTQAEDAYNRGRDWAIRLHGEKSALLAMPSMLLAELQYERNQVEAARQLLGDNFAMSRELGFVDNLIAGFITHSRIAFLDRNHLSAQAILEDAVHYAERYDFDRLRAHILCERSRQLLLLGEVREATRVLNADTTDLGRLTPSAHATSTTETLAIAHARLFCETGKEVAGLTLIKSWFSFAKSRRCTRSFVRLAVLLARLSLRNGNRPAALRYLIEGLDAGAAGGFVRSFLDEGELVTELLNQLHLGDPDGSTPALRTAGQILRIGGEGAPKLVRQIGTDATLLDAPGTESLSEREIEILQLAGSSMLNSEIGASLGLAESTVKWYWQRIFLKMGVHRRAQALVQARRMGLLRS